MHTTFRMQQYQQQAVVSASPEQLVSKLYDIAVSACLRGDRVKLRRALVELMSGLDLERGGEIATGLFALYQYLLTRSIDGDLDEIAELLSGLRDTWRESVLHRCAA